MSPGAEARRAYAEQIAGIVGVEYGLSAEDVLAENREPYPTEARWIVMTHCRAQGWTLEQVGDAVGRDHSTVTYALSKLERRASAFVLQVLDALPPFHPQAPLGARWLAARWAGAAW